MQQTVYLKDYQLPAYLVDTVYLDFSLQPSATGVVSSVRYRRNPAAAAGESLWLDGQDMELLSVALDGQELTTDDYSVSESGMRIENVPECFELTIATRINPEANKSLEGLYRSGGNYCTQCEAEGFRKITYYPDRPDVMAPFTVRMTADKAENPVLLSNGNPVAQGELDGGRHWAEWRDPFAKPGYLFALVAGDLQCVEDQFHTSDGRDITLRIYTEAHHIDHCAHAMASLKRAMRWDEQRFGLCYDLDLFMVVAVDDFNMGAMENKGLNIFNSRLVFASPETATDDDYIAIEAVIGHEYFHNWTGNRVTCRDWFQLSLKEGLTVFRDQEFTADLHSRAVKRIEDVRLLRSHQFAEDAGPMAHPIRPASYMEINNFYTVTVYEKGAEVVRLYHTLLGSDGFRRGMDLYFRRHDGQAVSTEDFLAAMRDANDIDLAQMQRWYDQAGTPKLVVRMAYDEQDATCTLHVSQSCPATPESSEKQPFLIPLTLGLLLPDGKAVPLQLAGEEVASGSSRTLLVREAEQEFVFTGVREQPLPSLLRGFSAPVELDYPYTATDDAFLMRHDEDSFNRWAAAQRLAMRTMQALLAGDTSSEVVLIDALHHVLTDAGLGAALKAEALLLPSEADIAEACSAADPGLIHQLREQLRVNIAAALRSEMEALYRQLSTVTGFSDEAMQARKLKNVCLSYLVRLGDKAACALVYAQFEQADNMTDQYAALAALADCDCPERELALAAFEAQWRHEANVMDKWFGVQAASSLPGTLEHVQSLMAHPCFDARNPNKVRALIGTFAMRNPSVFHAADGSGYAFVAEQVLLLDAFNPQVASRMVRALMNWKRIEPARSALMRAQLQRINDAELSPDVREIVSKSL
ncbi:aminopeptidase N [Mariprofundus ferrooxydans]|uniref:Aminopeptidase N n=1 Tax=Mariprofundus ferrooxydans PV-1 TaxID=314345 RepID=Q0EYA8_9PROT|nr:aminopeptidase N [Mariprofundus ferrooxydans]EAU54284.1 aminopeptidase N [Mariprofundus ferrooxydans PV-1]KON47826.1 aminopeptidase [Mariprofundus ferrooxydans]